MASPEEKLQRKLAKLRELFISQLPEKIHILRNLWKLMDSENWGNEDTHSFYLVVHSLIGTAGTFDFPELAEKARQLESLLTEYRHRSTTPSQQEIEHAERLFVSLCNEIHFTYSERDKLGPIAESDTTHAGREYRVLIVDDDPEISNIIADHLRLNGFIVDTLFDPATMLNAIRKFKPSIILMDLVFPQSDHAGAAAIEVLRDNNIDIPVIFISVKSDMRSRLNTIRTGAFSYLTKPINLDLLVSHIKAACNTQPDLPYRVLIIDDDNSILRTHAEILKDVDMIVETLDNPLLTLEVLDEFRPELILMDMHMPQCSGIETAMVIRQIADHEDIPIVFLSAEQDQELRLLAIKHGSDDFITKPADPEYLVRAVQARIDKARKYSETRKCLQTTISNLANAKKSAEGANKNKSDFISKMSHELRTPLNSILGFAQLLELDHDKTLTDQQKSNIQQVLSSGWHLLALINDILDISKIESGRLSLNKKDILINEIIEQAIQMNGQSANERNITIHYNNRCPDTLSVFADATRLQQVIVNLLSNAIKYNTDSGNISITVKDEPENTCKVTISDTGRGLPENKIEKLFTPFNRLGLEDSKLEGSGIGLALSARLVELMDGEIGAENNSEAGASFWFTLKQYELQQPPVSTYNTGISRHRPCVLFIEEDEYELNAVSQSLTAHRDIDILAACDAESALNIASNAKPDIILLDIELSTMDGITMLNALRSKTAMSQTPVIAFSSTAHSSELQPLSQHGFYKHYNKPYNLAELIATIDEVLDTLPEETLVAKH